MNSKECSAYTKEALVEKASKQLHLTKSNASFLSKEEICDLFKTCKGSRRVLLPSTELRVEKDDKQNTLYFIPRRSPLSYEDYEILVDQSPKESIVKIAKRLKMEDYEVNNKDTVGIILSQIKQYLDDRKAGLDPIKIKGPKRTNTNNNANANRNNRNNNNVNRNNNNNNNANANRNNNNNNNANANRNNNNANANRNNANANRNNANANRNNANANNLKPMNNQGVTKVNNIRNNVVKPINTSGNMRLRVNAAVNKPTVRANAVGNVSIKNLGTRVKVNLSTRKNRQLKIGGSVGSGTKTNDTLVRNLIRTYGLTDPQSRLKFLQAVNAVGPTVASISRLGPDDQAEIKKRLKYGRKKPEGNLAKRLFNVANMFNTVSDMKRNTSEIKRQFPNVPTNGTRAEALKKAMATIMRQKMRKSNGGVLQAPAKMGMTSKEQKTATTMKKNVQTNNAPKKNQGVQANNTNNNDLMKVLKNISNSVTKK